MHMHLRRALLFFLPSLTIAASYPPPEPCSGWCFHDLRDPAVVLKDNTYYRFTTEFNFTISTAPSMSGPWEKKGAVLHNGTMIVLPLSEPKQEKGVDEPKKKEKPKKQGLWAPDVTFVDGVYYLTYSVTRNGDPSEIGFATSDSMEPGSWTDHGSIGLPERRGAHRIDSNLFQAGNGSTPILNYGSYANGLYQVPLTLPPKELNGEVQHIALNDSNDAMEAAYQFQWTVKEKQWFYLFFSSGRCCNNPATLPKPGEEYKIMVCRSDAATGPFVDDHDIPCTNSGGKLVLETHDDMHGPGGQGVLYDEQVNAPVMYYHYMNTSTGYKVEDVWFGRNRLNLESGWPVLVGADGKAAVIKSGAARTEAAAISVVLAAVVVLCSTLATF